MKSGRITKSAPDKSLRPGESVLLPPVELLRQTVTHIAERIAERISKGNWRSINGELLKLQAAVWGLEQLMSFGGPPGPELLRKELVAGAKKLIFSKLMPPNEVLEAYHRAGEARKGRQPKRRHVAAAALEAKQNNRRNSKAQQLTRLELAKMFCPCGKEHHDRKCAERLRRDMQRLTELIHRIDLFSRTRSQLPA